MEDIKKEVSEQLNHYKNSLDSAIDESYEVARKSSKLTRDLLSIIKGCVQYSESIKSIKNYLIELGINSNTEIPKEEFHKKVSNISGLEGIISKSEDAIDSLDEDNYEEVTTTLTHVVDMTKFRANMIFETNKKYRDLVNKIVNVVFSKIVDNIKIDRLSKILLSN